MLGGHHEHCFDPRTQPLVHERHLKLELEVGHRAQAADDHLGAPPLQVLDEQTVEGIDLDIRLIPEHVPKNFQPLVHGEQGLFFSVHQNRDRDAIEQPRAARDDVDMPVGRRIERSRIHREGGHRG